MIDDFGALLQRFPNQCVAHHGDVQDERSIVEKVVLAQHAHASAFGNTDAAARGLLVAGHDPDESGLTRAIGAD